MLGLLIPALVYILITLPPVQHAIKDVAETELTKLLGANVEIGDVNISPFNRVAISDALVYTGERDTIATIDRLAAGINLKQLLLEKNIVITYAQIVGLDGRIYRATPDSPLNIQPIIDALSPKDKTKPPTKFDFKANTVVLRDIALRYDILDAPRKGEGIFDPNHVAITRLRADLTLPRIANDDFVFDIKQLALHERCGFDLKSLTGDYHVTATGLEAIKPLIKFNSSQLMVSDIKLKYSSFKTMLADIKSATHTLSVLDGTRIVPSDLSPFVPALADITSPIDITAHLTANLSKIDIDVLQVTMPGENILVDLRGQVTGLDKKSDLAIDLPLIDVRFNGGRAAEIASRFVTLSPTVSNLLSRGGNIEVKGGGVYSLYASKFDGTLLTDAGNAVIDASYSSPSGASKEVAGMVKIDNFDAGAILQQPDLGIVSLDADVTARFGQKLENIIFNGNVSRLDYKGYSYTGITADVDYNGAECHGSASIDDPGLKLALNGSINLESDIPQIEADLDAPHVNLGLIPGLQAQQGNILSLAAKASLSGKNINHSMGNLHVDYITLATAKGKAIKLDDIDVETDNLSSPQYFSIASDLVDGRIEGRYTITSLPADVKHIIANVLPTLVNHSGHNDTEIHPDEDFTFNFTLKPTARLDSIVKLPVNIVQNVELSGMMNGQDGTMAVNLLAPYIIKGKMLLRNTALDASVNGNDSRSNLYFTTTAVTKKDNITLALNSEGFHDRIDSRVAWNYNRPKRYDGTVNFTTSFERTDSSSLVTRVDVNPSDFSVNDTVWQIQPTVLKIYPGPRVTVDDLRVDREGQYVNIDGAVSRRENDRLNLDLSNIDLDYIFETLAIDNVMFGGVASGEFEASSLLSGSPKLKTDCLDVHNLKYNHCLMGDAKIKSAWNNARRAITIDAVLDQPNGCTSYIDGAIMPMVDSLDFHFKADKAPVGFMKPFMQAFTSDVQGYASGDARLWGSFKYIDMVGDLYAQDLKLKLDFTNTWYTCTDSVHLDPGHIAFNNVELSDMYGHKAKLNGWLTHECFKKPRFEFNVTGARDLLVYDVKGDPQKDIWYGRVFGNGTARVSGEPGKVDIDINMTTAANSTFTFVLSDAEEAYDYNFITFRDRDADKKVVEVVEENPDPEIVQEWYRQLLEIKHDYTSVYNMDIKVRVNPDAEVVLVMDPVGGDRIRAFGNGDLRLTYSSGSEDLRMYGDYTLDRGNYNFTLQDIIIKEFNILGGSAIRFNGDPYAALLDIKADYVVNANLSDLDESFLTDKDLNRTNVPVHARMLVTGDMRQPDIAFDLAFPTLNSDIDRKVRSIISTDEMMSRQIVYLLTLSRFYTPDYMSTTSGNELVSMASSTLSSQISSILGGISDNWNIAPNLRSDKGDFSDVEFDLALSSTLLNNRLLFNGNFGYRDNALNNNSFIGDFDIEYLLNRSGSIRLKAYNRYNDQNYYVKSALTTQGVGVMFRKDFDNFFSFLKPFRKKKSAAPADSTATTPSTPEK